MLIHACVVVSPKTTAEMVFGNLFGMKLSHTFEVSTEIMASLFKISGEAQAMVYDSQNAKIEVFVLSDPPKPGVLQHLCLGFQDRNTVISKAEKLGFEIRKYTRSNSEVSFVIDPDGNLYEIKSV